MDKEARVGKEGLGADLLRPQGEIQYTGGASTKRPNEAFEKKKQRLRTGVLAEVTAGHLEGPSFTSKQKKESWKKNALTGTQKSKNIVGFS